MSSQRRASIDLVRGGVMVLMALDHARDYWGDITLNPMDLDTTTPALWFTRWVTHFCAPVFVFLAGVSAFLAGTRMASRSRLARFLVSRGLFLLLLEFTVVHGGWFLSFTTGWFVFQVIAAIGVSLMCLGGLVFLPVRWVGLLGLAILVGHNLLDPVQAGGWWTFLHAGPRSPSSGFVPVLGSVGVVVAYPILPWLGVMCAGYGLGPLFRGEQPGRGVRLLWTGVAVTLTFLIVRGTNAYGDPDPWVSREPSWLTLVSFLDCEKYPPSLAYLTMTLGPALCLLGLLELSPPRSGPLSGLLLAFGRVPLFYYVAHLYLLHLSAGLYYRWKLGSFHFFRPDQALPEGYGNGLGLVYLAWVAAIALLFGPCRWYGAFKRRRTHPLWSYL